MPRDSLFVSILREPGELFQSTFRFFYENVPSFRGGPKQNDPDSIEKWLNNSKNYFKTKDRRGYWFFAKNHVMFDFGYDPLMERDSEIDKAIKQIDKVFDFILISNYMSESLVLLADMLCCPLADISSAVLNARVDREKQDQSRTDRIRKKVREWNKADSALFDYFNKTLWDKIEKFGFQKMKTKVKQLNNINQNLMAQCSGGKKNYNELVNAPWKNIKYYQPKGIDIVSYDLKEGKELNETCINLLAPEDYLTEVVHQHQKQRQPKRRHRNLAISSKLKQLSIIKKNLQEFNRVSNRSFVVSIKPFQ